MTAPKPPSPPPIGMPPDCTGADARTDDAWLDALPPADVEALRWSVRVSDGLSAEARLDFERWLDADPAHRIAYEDIAGVWDAIGEIPAADNAHLRARVAIDTAADTAARGGAAPRPVTPVRRSRRGALHAVIAGLTLGVVGGGGWLGWNHWQAQPVFQQQFATQRGKSLDETLPDGSRIQLDTATQVDVTFYRHRRELRLPEGQIFLNVAADATRPFHVVAGAARITVIGTRFSVRYLPSLGNADVQVAVDAGRVKVASQGGAADLAEAIVLHAGQALRADGQGRLGAVVPVAAHSVAAWRDRRLSFDNTPLAGVLAEIGRYGDAGVRVQDPAVGSLPVTGSVDLRHLDVFVQSLPRVLPVRVERRRDGWEIVSHRR